MTTQNMIHFSFGRQLSGFTFVRHFIYAKSGNPYRIPMWYGSVIASILKRGHPGFRDVGYRDTKSLAWITQLLSGRDQVV